MRSLPLRLSTLAALSAFLLISAPSLAQPGDPASPPAAQPDAQPAPALPPPSDNAQPAVQPTAPAPAPERAASARTSIGHGRGDADADRPAGAGAENGDPRRAEGVRLALDLGFERAIDGANDRLNAGTPTLLPLGVDVSFRTSPAMLVGFHGYAALASRDDCIKVDSCRARAYGFGGHIEHPFSRSTKLVPWIRYGAGYELVYHGGAPLDPAGHLYRGAIDLLDLRVGADYVLSRNAEDKKSARIGAFLGFTGGLVVNQSGVSYTQSSFGGGGGPKNLDNASQAGHLWFVMGVRATLDP
jgi:hypothetical protein